MKVDRVWCSSILYTGLDMCSSHCKKKKTLDKARGFMNPSIQGIGTKGNLRVPQFKRISEFEYRTV